MLKAQQFIPFVVIISVLWLCFYTFCEGMFIELSASLEIHSFMSCCIQLCYCQKPLNGTNVRIINDWAFVSFSLNWRFVFIKTNILCTKVRYLHTQGFVKIKHKIFLPLWYCHSLTWICVRVVQTALLIDADFTRRNDASNDSISFVCYCKGWPTYAVL